MQKIEQALSFLEEAKSALISFQLREAKGWKYIEVEIEKKIDKLDEIINDLDILQLDISSIVKEEERCLQLQNI